MARCCIRLRSWLWALALCVAACNTRADSVCEDIGDCSHNGSDDWISACDDQAKQLADESARSNCGHAYDAYFACADDHFVCRGNKTGFPGCAPELDALSRCLVAGQSNNACGELASKTHACGAASPDGGVEATMPASVESCTAAGLCGARCYLDNVPDVCAPTPFALTAFGSCLAHCAFP